MAATRTDHETPALLPGGVGLSRLTVYDTAAPDGLIGGSAHVHLACTEGYVVVGGRGAVQTLGTRGYEQTPLEPGRVVWFAPGIVHRLVNSDGRLEILTIMQNGGLPEAGDAVLTFPSEVLADPERYLNAAAVPARPDDPVEDGNGNRNGLAAAHERRDLAIQGFAELREAFERDSREGREALQRFYDAAVALVQPKLPAWRELWESTALRLTEETGGQLDALARGDTAHLESAEVHELDGPVEQDRLGMCGFLDTYPTGPLAHQQVRHTATQVAPASGARAER